jgi:hypothetical protein
MTVRNPPVPDLDDRVSRRLPGWPDERRAGEPQAIAGRPREGKLAPPARATT